MLHEEFMQIMESAWNIPNNQPNEAKRLVSKMKATRRILRQ
jgi:hypothetical protein